MPSEAIQQLLAGYGRRILERIARMNLTQRHVEVLPEERELVPEVGGILPVITGLPRPRRSSVGVQLGQHREGIDAALVGALVHAPAPFRDTVADGSVGDTLVGCDGRARAAPR